MTIATTVASRLWSNSGLLQANEVGSRVPPDPTLSTWPAGRGVRPQIPQESFPSSWFNAHGQTTSQL